MPSVRIRGTQKTYIERKGCVKRRAGMGVMQPDTKERLKWQKLEKERKTFTTQ